MASRNTESSMTSLAQLGALLESPLFWIDKTPPGHKEREIVDSLPLELPAGELYGLSFRGNLLVISGANNPISSYRLSRSSTISGIEGTEEGILIRLHSVRGINAILISNEVLPIPKHAISHTGTSAPISLLEEYVELRTKEKSQELTRNEQRRKAVLLGEIGDEYKRINQQNELGSSYRSTPEPCGESRSGGSGRAG